MLRHCLQGSHPRTVPAFDLLPSAACSTGRCDACPRSARLMRLVGVQADTPSRIYPNSPRLDRTLRHARELKTRRGVHDCDLQVSTSGETVLTSVRLSECARGNHLAGCEVLHLMQSLCSCRTGLWRQASAAEPGRPSCVVTATLHVSWLP